MQNFSRENLRFTKKMLVILQRTFLEEFNDRAFRRISINHIKLNTKRTMATIYLDTENAGPESNVIEKLQGLNPFLRKRISDELNLFKCPFLKFVKDLHVDKAILVDSLITSAINESE